MKKALGIFLIALAIAAAGFGVGYQFGNNHGQSQAKIWEKPPRSNHLNTCVAGNLRGYDAEVLIPKDHWDEWTLRILNQGQEVGSWKVHLDTVFTQYGEVLYLADYSPIASGCTIVAHDLKQRKELWKTNLIGLGPVSHSKYHNYVDLEVEGDVIVVRGKEAYGQYIEKVDAKTGKILFNQAFPPMTRASLFDEVRWKLGL